MNPTSTSGRIRVDREAAGLLSDLLREAHHRTVIRRADAKDLGNETTEFNRKILVIKKLRDELSRTMEEMGWIDGPA